jgi:hypothetical protein
MKGLRWAKRRAELHDEHRDPNEDEMAARASEALAATIAASAEAQRHAEEAQRLFGTIRREIAVAQAKPKPKGRP